jgi:hypothetical protein
VGHDLVLEVIELIHSPPALIFDEVPGIARSLALRSASGMTGLRGLGCQPVFDISIHRWMPFVR